MKDKIGTQRRVLLVFETLLAEGALSIEALTQKVPVSQSAVYRALRQLVEAGWVDQNISQTAFGVAPRMATLMNTGRVGVPAAAAFRQVLKSGRLQYSNFVDFVMIRDSGDIVTVDSTDRALPLHTPLSVIDNVAARAAICSLSREDRVRFLTRYLAKADVTEKAFFMAEGFVAMFRFPKGRRYLTDNDAGVAFAFTFNDQTGAICVRPKLKTANPERGGPYGNLHHLKLFFEAAQAPASRATSLAAAGVTILAPSEGLCVGSR